MSEQQPKHFGRCQGQAEFVGIVVHHQNAKTLADLDTRGPDEEYCDVYRCLTCDRWSYFVIENPTEEQRRGAVLGFGPSGE